MTIYKRLILLTGIILVSLTSCHKNSSDTPTGPKQMKDLIIPPSFNWESTHQVSLTLAVDLPGSIGLLSRINIYDGNPLENGIVLLNGSAGYNFPFTSDLRIPTALKQLYLELKTADGFSRIAVVNITSDIQYTFTLNQNSLKEIITIGEPDCSSGCDVTVTGNSVTVKNGKTYCITSAFTGTVNFEFWNGGGTLKICSNANISSINSLGGTNCSIVVTAGGTLNVTNSFSMDGNSAITVYPTANAHFNGGINMNQSGTHLTNYSSGMTIGQAFSPNGTVLNYGTLGVTGDYNINGNGILNNQGTLNISGSLQTNHDMTNTGTIEVQGSANLNSSSIVENDCKFIVHGSLNVNPGTFTMNNGYLKVYLGINLNSGVFKLMNQSQVSAQTMTLNSSLQGTGSRSTVKTTTSTINGAQVTGPIEFATQNGTISNGSAANFVNGATLVSWANMNNYIPTSTCNPEGSGMPVVTDTDGDGVPDTLDDYPNDATRAYNNYFPGKNQFATLAFEDLWPSMGDYDMNDLVLDCNYWYITNAQNKVVDIKPKFYARAAGATLQNAFGFQLDGVLPAAVQSVQIAPANTLRYNYITVAANGVEANQAKAVIIPFDNYENVIHRAGGSMYNTINNGYYGLSDTVFINLHFATPQTQSDVGTPPYNPFLIRGLNRGIEIHMPDHLPTSLADPTYFGTGDDSSDPATGRYYKSQTGLPWGIITPQKFDYTWETVEVVFGHLKFGTWAESGGVQYPDWYKNLSGYRDPSQIYTIPGGK